MHIIESLRSHKIEYTLIASDMAATFCPFCEKIPQGRPRATLNIDLRVETGHCSTCKKNADWEEIKEVLGITKSEEQPEEKKIKPLVKTNPRIELEPLPPAERIKKLGPPETAISFEEWRGVIKENFPELVFVSEAAVSIICQILIKDVTNPFSLVLVDVPSAGKTIAVNFFADIPELTHVTDKFSPASFVSNAANVKKEELQKTDLLPKLQYKMFLIRDLATMFAKQEDALRDAFGTLTRVLDGEGFSTDSGVHGQRGYVGEYLFMILAASTPIPSRVWDVMAMLGSRLFFLSINAKDKSEEELADQLVNTAYKDKEKLCRKATLNFLKTLWAKYPEGVKWNKENDPRDVRGIISRCAKLLAKLRGSFKISKNRDFQEFGQTYEFTPPVIEKADRINQWFYNECRGHALACGRNQIDRSDLKLIVELTIDSAPTIRAKLFRKLLECNGILRTSEVEEALKCSKPTALKEMETLKILGICNISQINIGKAGGQEQQMKLVEEFEWFLSDECRKIRGLETPPEQDMMFN